MALRAAGLQSQGHGSSAPALQEAEVPLRLFLYLAKETSFTLGSLRDLLASLEANKGLQTFCLPSLLLIAFVLAIAGCQRWLSRLSASCTRRSGQTTSTQHGTSGVPGDYSGDDRPRMVSPALRVTTVLHTSTIHQSQCRAITLPSPPKGAMPRLSPEAYCDGTAAPVLGARRGAKAVLPYISRWRRGIAPTPTHLVLSGKFEAPAGLSFHDAAAALTAAAARHLLTAVAAAGGDMPLSAQFLALPGCVRLVAVMRMWGDFADADVTAGEGSSTGGDADWFPDDTTEEEDTAPPSSSEAGDRGRRLSLDDRRTPAGAAAAAAGELEGSLQRGGWEVLQRMALLGVGPAGSTGQTRRPYGRGVRLEGESEQPGEEAAVAVREVGRGTAAVDPQDGWRQHSQDSQQQQQRYPDPPSDPKQDPSSSGDALSQPLTPISAIVPLYAEPAAVALPCLPYIVSGAGVSAVGGSHAANGSVSGNASAGTRPPCTAVAAPAATLTLRLMAPPEVLSGLMPPAPSAAESVAAGPGSGQFVVAALLDCESGSGGGSSSSSGSLQHASTADLAPSTGRLACVVPATVRPRAPGGSPLSSSRSGSDISGGGSGDALDWAGGLVVELPVAELLAALAGDGAEGGESGSADSNSAAGAAGAADAVHGMQGTAWDQGFASVAATTVVGLPRTPRVRPVVLTLHLLRLPQAAVEEVAVGAAGGAGSRSEGSEEDGSRAGLRERISGPTDWLGYVDVLLLVPEVAAAGGAGGQGAGALAVDAAAQQPAARSRATPAGPAAAAAAGGGAATGAAAAAEAAAAAAVFRAGAVQAELGGLWRRMVAEVAGRLAAEGGGEEWGSSDGEEEEEGGEAEEAASGMLTQPLSGEEEEAVEGAAVRGSSSRYSQAGAQAFKHLQSLLLDLATAATYMGGNSLTSHAGGAVSAPRRSNRTSSAGLGRTDITTSCITVTVPPPAAGSAAAPVTAGPAVAAAANGGGSRKQPAAVDLESLRSYVRSYLLRQGLTATCSLLEEPPVPPSPPPPPRPLRRSLFPSTGELREAPAQPPAEAAAGLTVTSCVAAGAPSAAMLPTAAAAAGGAQRLLGGEPAKHAAATADLEAPAVVVPYEAAYTAWRAQAAGGRQRAAAVTSFAAVMAIGVVATTLRLWFRGIPHPLVKALAGMTWLSSPLAGHAAAAVVRQYHRRQRQQLARAAEEGEQSAEAGGSSSGGGGVGGGGQGFAAVGQRKVAASADGSDTEAGTGPDAEEVELLSVLTTGLAAALLGLLTYTGSRPQLDVGQDELGFRFSLPATRGVLAPLMTQLRPQAQLLVAVQMFAIDVVHLATLYGKSACNAGGGGGGGKGTVTAALDYGFACDEGGGGGGLGCHFYSARCVVAGALLFGLIGQVVAFVEEARLRRRFRREVVTQAR
ncbi:hypothetical protein Agub_g4359 [Astrephomene gubernaculifera]|uniref:Uncharacterized protein n=1 Tax=Astrephomene gubernaculifera TaxID=47775 RepID=A0AAD3HJ58_9CHLO|nr:hypothetical protein Agub_g4359 [Astrephomene gubernaculifera]